MLVGDADVLGVEGGDLLMVAADVLFDEGADLWGHDLLCGGEAVGEGDDVAFGFEAGEEFGFEGFEVVEVPGFEVGDVFIGERFGGADEDVVEEVVDFAGDVGPAGAADLAGLGMAFGVGVGFGVPVVVAAVAGVGGVGHGVVGPEGDVDAGKLAEVGELAEVGGGEPAGGDPVVEGVDGLALRDFEGEERFGADHGLGGLSRGVFEVGGAEGAGLGLDVVFEEDGGATAGAAGFGGTAGDGTGGVVEFFEGGGVIVFFDGGGGGGDLFDVAAVGAVEGSGGGVEVEACAGSFAGEFAVGWGDGGEVGGFLLWWGGGGWGGGRWEWLRGRWR